MKKQFIAILAFAGLISTSCGSDDGGNQASDSPVLVKKVTETVHAGDNSDTRTVNFAYSGSKLTSVTDGSGTVTSFSYSGDKPATAIRTYGSGEVVTSTFTYNGDMLVSVSNNNALAETTDFHYVNGVLSGSADRYLASGEWLESGTREYIFGPDGNLISELIDNGFTTRRNDYTYDSHYNPFRFMAEPLRMIYKFEGVDPLNVNNQVAIAYFNPQTGVQTGSAYFEIEYNGNSYPIEIRKFSAQGNPLSTTLIEYY